MLIHEAYSIAKSQRSMKYFNVLAGARVTSFHTIRIYGFRHLQEPTVASYHHDARNVLNLAISL